MYSLKLTRKALVLIVLSVIVGCGNKNIEIAKKAIEENLVDPSSVQYRNITAYSENVVCGEVNAKNKMGGYVGFKSFIYNGKKPDEASLNPASDEVKDWCNDQKLKMLTYLQKEEDKASKRLIALKAELADKEMQCSNQSLNESERQSLCYELPKYKSSVDWANTRLEKSRKMVEVQMALSKGS